MSQILEVSLINRCTGKTASEGYYTCGKWAKPGDYLWEYVTDIAKQQAELTKLPVHICYAGTHHIVGGVVPYAS